MLFRFMNVMKFKQLTLSEIRRIYAGEKKFCTQLQRFSNFDIENVMLLIYYW